MVNLKLFLQRHKETLLVYCCTALILLWVYTAFSKLIDFTDFKHQLNNQTFGKVAEEVLLWLIPVSEITAGALLLYRKTRFLGFVLSALLMFLFTGYIGLVLLDYYDRTPCSCGGVLKAMGWHTHLLFNIFFLILSILGIYLERSVSAKPQTN